MNDEWGYLSSITLDLAGGPPYHSRGSAGEVFRMINEVRRTTRLYTVLVDLPHLFIAQEIRSGAIWMAWEL